MQHIILKIIICKANRMTDINWLINEYNNSITNKTIRHYSTTISTYYFFSGLSIYKCGWLRCEFYNNNNIL